MSKQVETLESIRTGSKIPDGVVLLTPTVIILGTTLLGHLVTDPLGLSAGDTFLAEEAAAFAKAISLRDWTTRVAGRGQRRTKYFNLPIGGD